MMYVSFSKRNFIAKHYLKDTTLPYGCCKIKKSPVVTNIYFTQTFLEHNPKKTLLFSEHNPKKTLLFRNIIQKSHYFFGTQSKKDITFSEYNPPKVYK